jgi:hypothetical protein
MAAPGLLRPESAQDVLDRIGRVPSGHREFTVPESAVRSFGIGRDLLGELLDRGLPSAGSGASRGFDEYDLLNIGIALGLPCDSWWRMRLWSRAFDLLTDEQRLAYQLHMTVDCPDAGHPGPCRLMLSQSVSDALPGSEPRRKGDGFDLAPVVGAEPELLAPLTELMADVEPLRFHLLPESLTTDLKFAALSGLANPRLATRFLADAAQRRGLPVRSAGGMILMWPNALPHEWLEVRHAGRWFAADPFMLLALTRWRLLDPARWPPVRSLPPIAWRLFPQWDDGAPQHIAGRGLVTHDGSWARMTLRVLKYHAVPPAEAIAGSS